MSFSSIRLSSKISHKCFILKITKIASSVSNRGEKASARSESWSARSASKHVRVRNSSEETETRRTSWRGQRLVTDYNCKLSNSFSDKTRSGWEGDGYGQLRYTHSASPYRSIATGGSHFLANGCFHPPVSAPRFPLTVSFAPCRYSREPFPFLRFFPPTFPFLVTS